MVIDCTLTNFKVPGFSDYTPPFGTKKPDGQPILAREANANIMMPFVKQRPQAVVENSSTTEIQTHMAFAIQTSGVTLTLGNGGFVGCRVIAHNTSSGSAAVVYGAGSYDNTSIAASEYADLEWTGSVWRLPKKIVLSDLNADQIDGLGRNLLEVFKVSTIAQVMAEIRRRCNNAGEIDNTGIPDFTGIMIGDYIDGLDLSGIAAAPGGNAPQAWNGQYKNNRIMVSGFNTYKGFGDTEITKNHILFTFRNVICQGQMKAANDNAGGYPATLMRTWLEGAGGDGTGVFSQKLKTALGGAINYLLTLRLAHSTKGAAAWNNFTVFLTTEIEVFGAQTYGDELIAWNTSVQYPIYAKSGVFRIKRFNGARAWWWEGTPAAAYSAHFAYVYYDGGAYYGNAGYATGGVAPAFCVA